MVADEVAESTAVIPERPTDLGFTRDRHFNLLRSAKADLSGPGPESITPVCDYGFRARGLPLRRGMTAGRKLPPRDRLQIAVPDLFLVGLRHIDSFQNAQRLAGIHGALL